MFEREGATKQHPTTTAQKLTKHNMSDMKTNNRTKQKKIITSKLVIQDNYRTLSISVSDFGVCFELLFPERKILSRILKHIIFAKNPPQPNPHVASHKCHSNSTDDNRIIIAGNSMNAIA